MRKNGSVLNQQQPIPKFMTRSCYLGKESAPHEFNKKKELSISLQQFKFKLNRPPSQLNQSTEISQSRTPTRSKPEIAPPLEYKSLIQKLINSDVNNNNEDGSYNTKLSQPNLWKINNPKSAQEKVLQCVRKKIEMRKNISKCKTDLAREFEISPFVFKSSKQLEKNRSSRQSIIKPKSKPFE